MQIKCPHCHRHSKTCPEALLGRIYVCTHCHQILRLEIHARNAVQWQSLATVRKESQHRMNGRDRDHV